MNTQIGFKSLHYSVAESSKYVKVEVVNYSDKSVSIGVKTIADTATDFDDFIPINKTIKIDPNSKCPVEVEIVDDDGWEPDEDFLIILYDPQDPEQAQLFGDNTKTRITILDDDKPGVLQFKNQLVQVKKSDKVVKLIVERVDGADGVA